MLHGLFYLNLMEVELILSKTEIDKVVKEKATKIDNENSALTNPQVSSNGMGLGGEHFYF